MSKSVASHLKGELSTLKEDIQIARENNFGRKIFETFAGEFSTTYLNDKAETRKIVSVLNDKEQELAESMVKLAKATKLLNQKNVKLTLLKNLLNVKRLLDNLVAL